MEIVSVTKVFEAVNENISPTKGFDSMKADSNTKPLHLAKSQKIKLKEDIEQKKMVPLDKAVNYLGADAQQKSFTEDEHYGMMVAKTLTRLNPKQKKFLQKKKISDALFKVEFHGEATEQPLQNRYTRSDFNFCEQQQQMFSGAFPLQSLH